MRNSLVIILISIIFSACVSSKEELAFEKPEIQIPKKIRGFREKGDSTHEKV